MSRHLSSLAPTISVVMPVYNTRAYVTAALDSIIGQTFPNWELICVDDGSNDGSLNILRDYEAADQRLHVVTRTNSGSSRARNHGMSLARGKYIAAMDSDDIALPDRLSCQLRYMEAHPECVALGANVQVVGPDLMPIYDELKPLDHDTIDNRVLAGDGSAIRHPVALFRTEALQMIGGYREECFTGEDTDLYLRLAECGRLANLPDILLLYRLRLGSITRTRETTYNQVVRRDAYIRRGLPVDPDFPDWKQTPIKQDRGRGAWAYWSHCAFNGGYLKTARRYAWRAVYSEPLAVASWKAVFREFFRNVPSERSNYFG